MAERNLFSFGFKGKEPRKPTTQPSSKLKRKADQQNYDATRRNRVFQLSWKEQFAWVEHDSEKQVMFCRPCQENPHLADKKSPLFNGTGPGANISREYRVDPLKSHNVSKEHNKVMEKIYAESKVGKNPIEKAIDKINEGQSARLGRLIRTSHFVAKEDIAMSKLKNLCMLQEKNGADMGPNYRTDKACREFIDSISESEKNNLADEINKAKFVSVLADGSVDRAVKDQENIYVRYVSGDGEIKTQLADIVELESAAADGVLSALESGITEVGLKDIESRKEKIVGCNFDGASVNMGKHNGVAMKLKQKLGDHIIPLHCVAHNLELSVLDAVGKNADIKKFNETMNSIYRYYHISAKQRRGLHEIAEIFNEEAYYFSGVKQLRWVASKSRAVEAVQKNLRITIGHLEHVGESDQDKLAPTAKGIAKKMRTEFFIKYMFFMLDFMGVIGRLSQHFQKKDLLITDVKSYIDYTKMELRLLKSEAGLGDNQTKFEAQYDAPNYVLRHGSGEIELEHKNYELQPDEIIEDTIQYIESRFKCFSEEPVIWFDIFDNRSWPHQDPEEMATFGVDEVTKLSQHFETVLREKDGVSVMVREWQLLKAKVMRKRDWKALHPTATYTQPDILKNVELENIFELVLICLTLSPSTAEVERGFSAMNRIKTSTRALMSNDCLKSLMRISCNTPGIQPYSCYWCVALTWKGDSPYQRPFSTSQGEHKTVVFSINETKR